MYKVRCHYFADFLHTCLMDAWCVPEVVHISKSAYFVDALSTIRPAMMSWEELVPRGLWPGLLGFAEGPQLAYSCLLQGQTQAGNLPHYFVLLLPLVSWSESRLQ